MALELKQQLRLSQQLVMTPQLQQAIKLLQLSRLELVGLVQGELGGNPVLEDAAEGEGGGGAAPGGPGASADREGAAPGLAPRTGESPPEPGVPANEPEPSNADKVADID